MQLLDRIAGLTPGLPVRAGVITFLIGMLSPLSAPTQAEVTDGLSPRDDAAATETETSALEERIRQERQIMAYEFVITPHKPSYLLPLSYNWTPNDDHRESVGGSLDNAEIKFQLSLKFPVWNEIFGKDSQLSFGYTQVSFWQAYNSALSRPFRETDHEPELMLDFLTDLNVLGMKGRVVTLGLVHQSNGRSEPVSRSWNRIYLNFVFSRGALVLGFKPWYRLPESSKDDENPRIRRYMGSGEITIAYNKTDRVYSMILRNNFRAENRGALELNWSFPFTRRIHGYIQYFNGFGESLLDYDESSNRLGVGILLVNWI